MSISVIMVSYHTGPVLPVAIASVLAQENLAELILVDNGNPPDVIAHLRQMVLSETRLKFITDHGNIGFAAGCNLGAKDATGDTLVFLNPDCILPPQAIATLSEELNRLPGTMLAGPYLVNPDGTEQRGGRRQLLTPITALGEIFGKGISRHTYDMPSETHDVAAISGACMCIRKADYEAMGGLDEGYFLHVEDLDFCMRIARAGKRIVCVPSVKVVHLLSTSGHAKPHKIEYFKAKGFIRYFEKHFKESALLLPLLNISIWGRYAIRRWVGSKRRVSHKSMTISRKLMVLAGSLTEQKTHNALTGKTVVVMGATSQVGIYTVKHLLASGAAVLAISRGEGLPFAHPHLKWLTSDIEKDDFSLEGFLADVAIHAAPQWKLPKILPVLAASDVKRVVIIGSTSIFSKAASGNRFEKDIVAKHTRAEQEIATVCHTQGIAWTVLRATLIYGAGLDENITRIARFIRRFGFVPLYPPALGRRQPVHAEDIALAALAAASAPETSNKAYNVSGGEIITYRAMIERLFNVLKAPVNIIETTLLPAMLGIAGTILRKPFITNEVALRMNEDMIFFHDDATRDFGYKPRPFLSGGISDIDGGRG